MYRMGQILLEMNCLESPDSHDSNSGTYIQICPLEAKLWRSGSCWLFVYLFSFPIQIQLFSLNSSNYEKCCISLDT